MKIITGLMLTFLFIGAAALFFTLPLLLLWNWLMPVIFEFIKITFWQAFGINFLAGILFRNTKK